MVPYTMLTSPRMTTRPQKRQKSGIAALPAGRFFTSASGVSPAINDERGKRGTMKRLVGVFRMIPVVFLTATALAVGPAPAAAQEVEYLGTERDWHSFQFTENGSRVCYMASRPTREEGNYTRRGDVFVLVTHRPGENSRNVVSFITGYTFQPGSDVTVSIGGEDFTLFTEGDTAWPRDTATDERLVNAMRRGANVVVAGVSSRGTRTTDTYSLFGFTATHAVISEACGIN